MASQKCTEDEFIAYWQRFKSAAAVARFLQMGVRKVQERRRAIENRRGISLDADIQEPVKKLADNHPARHVAQLRDGVVLIGSDAHYWPGMVSTAHRAFVKFCRDLTPAVVVVNGDVFDGATISRWPRIGWDSKPSVIDELKACEERLTEIENAAPKAKKVWTLGNHDARYENFLASKAPEYEGVPGFTLKDRFPLWIPCWSFFLNDTVIKHRFKGGIHATHNNTLWAGKTIVTGHLHSLKVTPFTDYTGTRWGVDSGTLADANGDQFVDYSEDNPKNHRSGFIVLTYHQGRLLWPEIAHVRSEGEIEFRGKVYQV